ncbi:MAG TPA: Ig-like domain-containing protein [Gemmatimonadaceae bacterium]|nr:Ig-like domain-containing protein [Gemmatimonadaceae bacterium]
MFQVSFNRRQIRSAATLAALISLAALAACGDSTGPAQSSSTTPPPPDVTPASITSNVTTPLTGVAGTQLNTPLQVTVLNKAGLPIDTTVVTFAVASGGGTLSSTSVRTDVNGKAVTVWTLGPKTGTQTVTATAGTLSPVTFTATASAGAAKNITKNSTDPQTAVAGANVAVPPSVKVTDQNGNPVASVTVTFAVATGGGSVSGGSPTTDANGVATAGSWKLGPTPGTNTVTATVTGITTPVTFTATGTLGAVASVKITNTAPSLTIGQTFTLTATAADANNNAITNPTFTWTSSNTAVATVSSTGVVTGVSGGTAVITVTSNGVSAQQTVTVIGGPSSPTGETAVSMSSSIGGVAIANNTAYVARSSVGKVGIVNLTTATLDSNIDVTAGSNGSAVDVAASATGNVIGIAVAGQNDLLFVNGATNTPTGDTVFFSATPVKMAITSTGSKLFVDLNSFQLEVVDPSTHTVTAEVPVGGTATIMKVAPGDSLLYIATRFSLFEISTQTNAIKRNLTNSGAPTGIVDFAVTPDGKTMFIADGSNTVTVFQLAPGGMPNGTITGFSSGPINALAVTPDGKQLWVAQNQPIGATTQGTYILDISSNTLPTVPPPNTAFGAQQPVRLLFTRLGTTAVIVDAALNQLVISK